VDDTQRTCLAGIGLDNQVESAYRGLLEHPTWSMTELAAHLSVDVDGARRLVGRLRELELVRGGEKGGRFRVVDPRVGLPALIARMDAELAQRRETLEEGRLAIADLVAGMGGTSTPTPAAHLQDVCWGARDIKARAAQLAAAASSELVTMCPPGSILLDDSVIAARRADGICCRLVFTPAERNRPGGEAWLQRLADAGADVRIGKVPTAALIVDSTTVALPVRDTAAGQTVGLATLRLPSAVTAVVELFERVWAEATPLAETYQRVESGLTDRERDLLDLLVDGVTDESAACRLGISVRTVRRMVSDLMQRLGARSRFEAGARAAERGWLQVHAVAGARV
jgi:DNA-binding CsgD family transcriptional regulator